MRIRRPIIVPAILALVAVGSILAGAAMPMATAGAPGVSVVASSSSVPNGYYHA